jgi:DNA-binding transcriptional LysR family regulator
VPEDLPNHNALTYHYQASPSEWRFITPEGRYTAVPVTGSIKMNNSLAIREAVLRGAGITLTPTFIVGDDIKAGRLQSVLREYRANELSIYAVYPERRHLSPKVRTFVEFMQTRISDPPYWD